MKKVILLSAIILGMFASCEPDKGECVELIIRDNPGPTEACCYYIDVPCD